MQFFFCFFDQCSWRITLGKSKIWGVALPFNSALPVYRGTLLYPSSKKKRNRQAFRCRFQKSYSRARLCGQIFHRCSCIVRQCNPFGLRLRSLFLGTGRNSQSRLGAFSHSRLPKSDHIWILGALGRNERSRRTSKHPCIGTALRLCGRLVRHLGALSTPLCLQRLGDTASNLSPCKARTRNSLRADLWRSSVHLSCGNDSRGSVLTKKKTV